MTDTFVSLAVEIPRDDIRLRRSREVPREATTDTAASEALSLLVEMADETFEHYGFDPMFAQVVAVDALLDGDQVHPGAEGALVDKVRELVARVAWAENPANWTIVEAATDEPWTGGTEADPVPNGGLDLKLADRPEGWQPEPEPPTRTAGGADLSFLPDGELRTQVALIMETNPDPEAMAKLSPQAVRIANQLSRRVIRQRFEPGSAEPDQSVRAVRRVDQVETDSPLDILYVREFGQWKATGTDGSGGRYSWSTITDFGAVFDASDEYRFGVRDDLSGRVVFDRARDETFEVGSVAEGWRIVDLLHTAATPPQILARRAMEKADRKNQEDNR